MKVFDSVRRLSSLLICFAAAVLVAAFVGISTTNLEVIVYKFLVFCPGVALVHLARKTLFPYIDLDALINEGNDLSRVDAAAILGVFLFYVVGIYAVTQAI